MDVEVCAIEELKVVNIMSSSAARCSGCGVRCRDEAGLCQLQGVDPQRFVLSVDNKNELRSRCE